MFIGGEGYNKAKVINQRLKKNITFLMNGNCIDFSPYFLVVVVITVIKGSACCCHFAITLYAACTDVEDNALFSTQLNCLSGSESQLVCFKVCMCVVVQGIL